MCVSPWVFYDVADPMVRGIEWKREAIPKLIVEHVNEAQRIRDTPSPRTMTSRSTMRTNGESGRKDSRPFGGAADDPVRERAARRRRSPRVASSGRARHAPELFRDEAGLRWRASHIENTGMATIYASISRRRGNRGHR